MKKQEESELEELLQRLKEVNEKMPKRKKDNMIRALVDEGTFRAVMAVAYKYDNGNMSDVVRRCINNSLDVVSLQLRTSQLEIEKGKINSKKG